MKTDWVNGDDVTTAYLNALGAAVNASSALTPEQFGAVGNGIANDTTALVNALNALGPGKTLRIDAGKIYTHTGVLTLAAYGCIIRGGGEIRATAEDTSAFIIQGDNVTIEDVTFSCPTTTTRGLLTQHHKVVVDSNVGTILRGLNIAGSKGGGIKVQSSNRFLIDNCRVENSLADALHTTHGSTNGVISNCRAQDCGDDGFAVVSYDSDAIPCSDIVTHGFYVKNSAAQGISVFGGNNIRYFDGEIDSTEVSAILVVCSETFESYGVSDVVIDSVRVVNANSDAATVGRSNGAVTLLNERDGLNVTGVVIRNITVRDTHVSAQGQVRLLREGTGTLNNIILGSMTFTGTGPSTVIDKSVSVAASDYRADQTLTGNASAPDGTVLVEAVPVASAVNHFKFQPNVAGSSPVLSVDGPDTNIAMIVKTKGNGNVQLNLPTGSDAALFVDGSSSDINLNLDPKGIGRLKTNSEIVGSWVSVPSTATSTGKQGQMAADGSFLYICTAANTWRRVAIASW